MIAYLEFSHAVPRSFYNPSTVRHEDTAIGYAIGRARNSIIMVVERACTQPHSDCPRSGCSRIV